MSKKKSKKTKRMFRKIKEFVSTVLNTKNKESLGQEWNPKFKGMVKGTNFESKSPIGGDKYLVTGVQLASWLNGEGYNIDIYNSQEGESKRFSLHLDELDLILASLHKLNYFTFDKEEYKK